MNLSLFVDCITERRIIIATNFPYGILALNQESCLAFRRQVSGERKVAHLALDNSQLLALSITLLVIGGNENSRPDIRQDLLVFQISIADNCVSNPLAM